MNIHAFHAMKEAGEKITMITCYDYSFANILAHSNIDCILVGDSAAMVMHGHSTTVMATVDMMVAHAQAVVRGAGNKFVIADMPFLSYRKSLSENMDAVGALMQTGAKAIKLEGALGNIELIRHIVDSGVPVMGHIGLTPQSIHQLGGFKVQGRDKKAAKTLVQQAKALTEAGCFALVLECLPSQVGAEITQAIPIPTIGIGAGSQTDGQVLVLQDLLGMNKTFQPKFLKQYMAGFDLIKEAFDVFCEDVKSGGYPQAEHGY